LFIGMSVMFIMSLVAFTNTDFQLPVEAHTGK
jgi:succinate dehydrogenase / fumarate reductase, cytochrome b subunit